MSNEMKVTDRRWWVRGESDAPPEVPSLKPTMLEELEARIAEKDLEIQQLLSKYRGASDEFEQARARLRKEITKDVERSRRSVIVSFLEVLDNLDRALDVGAGPGPDPRIDSFVQGVALVRQQFISTLEGLGVTRVDPMDQPFDPAKHEAVSTVPAPAPELDGRVIGVVRPGYVMGEDVLRPAQVAVARS
jgi:molecular chaperone GrpE